MLKNIFIEWKLWKSSPLILITPKNWTASQAVLADPKINLAGATYIKALEYLSHFINI